MASQALLARVNAGSVYWNCCDRVSPRLPWSIEHLLATEVELAHGRFTGRTGGVLNIRDGKLERLKAWLKQRRHELSAFKSTAYTDSINDLPLLESVTFPVVVDPEPRLAAIALERKWSVLHLHTTEPGALPNQ